MSGTLLLLLVGVAPTRSSLRVRVWGWRRSLGTVPLERSAYPLPNTPERYEDFQSLAQEVQRGGPDGLTAMPVRSRRDVLAIHRTNHLLV